MSQILNGLVKTANCLHGAYIQGFEGLEAGASRLSNYIKRPLEASKRALGNLVSYPVAFVARTAKQGIVKAVAVKNRILKRNQPEQTDQFLKSFRPELRALNAKIKESLGSLSQSCTKIFNKPVLIGEIPSLQGIASLKQQLQALWENEATPLTKALEAQKALRECEKILHLPQELRALKQRGISEEDIAHFQRALSQNLLYCLAKDATLENLGEAIGGKLVEEGFLLPDAYNPASIAATAVKTRVGVPIGRLAGLFTSATAAYFLVGKLLKGVSKNTRRAVQGSLILSLILLEYYNLNPVSNSFKEFIGNQMGDFSFYTVGLVSNYVGMRVFGSGENLPDYARKMMPSTLVGNSTGWVLQQAGMNSCATFAISFYLSHVAYNFDLYQTILRGRSIRQLTDMEAGRSLVYSQEVAGARRALTQYVLSTVSETVIDRMAELNFNPTFGTSVLAYYLSSAFMEQMPQVTFTPTLELEEALVEFRKKIPYCPVSLLVKAVDSILTRFNAPDVAKIASAFLVKTKESVKNTNLQALNQGNGSIEWKSLEKQLIRALQEVDAVSEEMLAMFMEQIESQFGDAVRSFAIQIENILDKQLGMLFPIIPNLDKQEEWCSIILMETLAKACILRVLLLPVKQDMNFTSALAPLGKSDLLKFASKLVHLVLDQRHPSSEWTDLPKALQRKTLGLLFDSQL